MSDEDMFAKAMSVVRPIAKTDKVNRADIKKPKQRVSQIHTLKKGERDNPATTFSTTEQAKVRPTDEPWTIKSSSISQEKLKRLGAGRPPIDLEIDLHGMNRAESLSALEKMMQNAQHEAARVLCIVHGRGLHSQGRPVLKETVYQWLESGPYSDYVLAAIPKPYTGGGSCLVLLRRKR